jgi:ferredoxin/flavodoxin---NADP+ reductase
MAPKLMEPNYTIAKIENPVGCLFKLWITPNDGEVPTFEAGQFVQMGVPQGDETPQKEANSYTIAGVQDGALEFYIVAVPDGDVSQKLATAKVGDSLWVKPKIAGKFVLSDAPDMSRLLLVGSGTGIASIVAMTRQEEEKLNTYERVVIVHQVRDVDHLLYHSELAAFCAADPRRRYLPFVSKPTAPFYIRDGHGVQAGYLAEAIRLGDIDDALKGEPKSDDTLAMLSGNPEMIKSVTTVLLAAGLSKHKRKDPGNIMSEKYW